MSRSEKTKIDDGNGLQGLFLFESWLRYGDGKMAFASEGEFMAVVTPLSTEVE